MHFLLFEFPCRPDNAKVMIVFPNELMFPGAKFWTIWPAIAWIFISPGLFLPQRYTE